MRRCDDRAREQAIEFSRSALERICELPRALLVLPFVEPLARGATPTRARRRQGTAAPTAMDDATAGGTPARATDGGVVGTAPPTAMEEVTVGSNLARATGAATVGGRNSDKGNGGGREQPLAHRAMEEATAVGVTPPKAVATAMAGSNPAKAMEKATAWGCSNPAPATVAEETAGARGECNGRRPRPRANLQPEYLTG